MKTFKIVIKRSTYYVREIQAKDFLDAKAKANADIWHSRYEDWGSSYEDAEVNDIEEVA